MVSRDKNAVFLIILAVIFVAEIIVMGILHWLSIDSPLLESILDGVLLATISAPFIYHYLIKDLSRRNLELSESLFRQKKAEKALVASQEQVEIVYRKLISNEEDQRKKIAHDLHDGIGQSIFAIKLGIENMTASIGEDLSPEIRTLLNKKVELLAVASKDIKRIAANLRPLMLEDLGLVKTLSWLVGEFRELFPSLQITVNIQAKESDIPEPIKLAIYRIAQEALTNIGKYAQASTVSVSLKRRDGDLTFCIVDNGVGFQFDDNQLQQGIGLSSMKERVSRTDGEILIQSKENQGTSIYSEWSHLN